MKSTDQIEERVKGGLAKKLGKDESDIRNESKLVEELGLDSLDTFDLLFELEKEFDIEIPTVDALGFVTVQNVIAYIQKRIQSK
ncbi:MAG TPA: acyl carrier protein [Candidatus Manganitrophaceae bacterium]|nr:acyl carrier protein [Candidatus Manganitrophaceae bacterium]